MNLHDLTDKRGLTESVLHIPRSRSRVSSAVYVAACVAEVRKGRVGNLGSRPRSSEKGGGDFLPYPSPPFCAFCAPGIPLPFKRLLRRLVTQLGVLSANMSIRTSLGK